MQNRIKALAEFIGVNENDIQAVDWKENFFTVESMDREYLILTDDEANREAAEMIKDSLFAFNTDFIFDRCGLDKGNTNLVLSFRSMQENCCETCNDLIFALIDNSCGFDCFVDNAICYDGRGHFISGYDGKEEENNGFYIYRIN